MANMKDFTALMEKYRQSHILQHMDILPAEKRRNFLKNAESLNIRLVFSLYNKEISRVETRSAGVGEVRPPEIFSPRSDRQEKELLKELKINL